MAIYSVDSDSILAATSTIRGTIERIQADTQSMLTQLTHLQGSWTGSAAVAFHSVVDQWRATQRQVEDSLTGINSALAAAGRQYADAETATASLFR